MKATLVIDMPKNCDECPFNYDMGIACDAMEDDLAYGDDNKEMQGEIRPSWCPLDSKKNRAIPMDFIKAFSEILLDRRERFVLETLIEVWEGKREIKVPYINQMLDDWEKENEGNQT